MLTVFLKDTTFLGEHDPDIFAGYVTLCERLPGERFFQATFYHE
jgi:hypothetical protein